MAMITRKVFRKGYCRSHLKSGFTMTEVIVVIVIVSLMVTMVRVNLFAVLGKGTFKAQLNDFVSTMQMAASAAAESGRKYEVVVDLAEQSYMLREISTPDLYQVFDDEIIVQKNFGNNCRAAYVWYDDDTFTNDSRAKFRAGKAGWQYGGKIVFFDRDENVYSVVVNRISRIVKLEYGDVEMPTPKQENEVPF